jgi:hypothetical protein
VKYRIKEVSDVCVYVCVCVYVSVCVCVIASFVYEASSKCPRILQNVNGTQRKRSLTLERQES